MPGSGSDELMSLVTRLGLDQPGCHLSSDVLLSLAGSGGCGQPVADSRQLLMQLIGRLIQRQLTSGSISTCQENILNIMNDSKFSNTHSASSSRLTSASDSMSQETAANTVENEMDKLLAWKSRIESALVVPQVKNANPNPNFDPNSQQVNSAASSTPPTNTTTTTSPSSANNSETAAGTDPVGIPPALLSTTDKPVANTLIPLLTPNVNGANTPVEQSSLRTIDSTASILAAIAATKTTTTTVDMNAAQTFPDMSRDMVTSCTGPTHVGSVSQPALVTCSSALLVTAHLPQTCTDMPKTRLDMSETRPPVQESPASPDSPILSQALSSPRLVQYQTVTECPPSPPPMPTPPRPPANLLMIGVDGRGPQPLSLPPSLLSPFLSHLQPALPRPPAVNNPATEHVEYPVCTEEFRVPSTRTDNAPFTGGRLPPSQLPTAASPSFEPPSIASQGASADGPVAPPWLRSNSAAGVDTAADVDGRRPPPWLGLRLGLGDSSEHEASCNVTGNRRGPLQLHRSTPAMDIPPHGDPLPARNASEMGPPAVRTFTSQGGTNVISSHYGEELQSKGPSDAWQGNPRDPSTSNSRTAFQRQPCSNQNSATAHALRTVAPGTQQGDASGVEQSYGKASSAMCVEQGSRVRPVASSRLQAPGAWLSRLASPSVFMSALHQSSSRSQHTEVQTAVPASHHFTGHERPVAESQAVSTLRTADSHTFTQHSDLSQSTVPAANLQRNLTVNDLATELKRDDIFHLRSDSTGKSAESGMSHDVSERRDWSRLSSHDDGDCSSLLLMSRADEVLLRLAGMETPQFASETKSRLDDDMISPALTTGSVVITRRQQLQQQRQQQQHDDIGTATLGSTHYADSNRLTVPADNTASRQTGLVVSEVRSFGLRTPVDNTVRHNAGQMPAASMDITEASDGGTALRPAAATDVQQSTMPSVTKVLSAGMDRLSHDMTTTADADAATKYYWHSPPSAASTTVQQRQQLLQQQGQLQRHSASATVQPTLQARQQQQLQQEEKAEKSAAVLSDSEELEEGEIVDDCTASPTLGASTTAAVGRAQQLPQATKQLLMLLKADPTSVRKSHTSQHLQGRDRLADRPETFHETVADTSQRHYRRSHTDDTRNDEDVVLPKYHRTDSTGTGRRRW